MNRLFYFITLGLMAVFAISGCRTTRYDFTKIQLNTNLQSKAGIALAVQDLRPFVVNGEKPPNYIGIHRDGVGVPKDGANTKSGKPLAEDIASLLATNLSKNGMITRQFVLLPSDDELTAIQKGASPPADRILILRMEQFRSDSWAEVELNWKFRLDIYDEKGKHLATSENEGLEEGLKRNYTGAISDGQAQKALSEKLFIILQGLLAEPACIHALTNGNWQHGSPSPAVTSIAEPQKAKTGQASDDKNLSPENERLRNSLNKGDYQAALEWAKEQHSQEHTPQLETSDFIAEIIWEQRGKSDDTLVDALSYLCLVIGKSQSPRYRLIMEVVKNEARTRKLRKYADKSLRSIPADATVEQFQPGKRQLIPISQ